MNEQSLIKTPRQFMALMAGYILVLSVIAYSGANYGYQNGVDLKVGTYDKLIAHYNRQTFSDGNYFISGMQGDLHYSPQTLGQALLLHAATNTTIDFLDVIALAIVAAIIFFMFKGQKSLAVFTKSVSSGFLVLIFALGILGSLTDGARFELAIKYIPYITHGRFKGNYTFKVTSFYYMAFPMLMFLMQLPKRGLELQKEAELTI